jgi:dihydrolipoyl dehydrogenase
MSQSFDIVFIGGGPGGYTGAIRAGQLGFKVACIEKRGSLGGTCLNVGCIPSKALLQTSELYEEAGHAFAGFGIKTSGLSIDLPAMMGHKLKIVEQNTKGIEFLFKKNNVTYIPGAGTIAAPGKIEVKLLAGGTETVEAKHIIVSTGSDVMPLPGVRIDEERVVSSTGALSLKQVPKRLLVVGGGVIGLELGSVWKRLGAEVTVVEFLEQIGGPMDQEIAKQFQRSLQRQGLAFHLSKKVTKVDGDKSGLKVSVEPAQGGKAEILEADIVLVSIGRRPYTEGLGLEKAGVAQDKRGRVVTDRFYRTNIGGIYAVGDVREGAMLAHKAEDEGIALVELIAGKAGHVNYNAIPSVVYTSPEIASVGRTEEELKAAGIALKIGKFPFTANAKARIMGKAEGLVKILADAKTDEVYGVHMLGPDAGNMIAEAALAIEFRASAEDIARTCHPHPTLSEAIRQAAMGVGGWTIQA